MFEREKVSEKRSYFHILPFFSFSSPNFRLLWHPLPDLPEKKGARFLQKFVWTVKGHFFRVCTYHIEHNKNKHKSFTVYSQNIVLFHRMIVAVDQVLSKILQEMCFNMVSSQMLCFATQRDDRFFLLWLGEEALKSAPQLFQMKVSLTSQPCQKLWWSRWL